MDEENEVDINMVKKFTNIEPFVNQGSSDMLYEPNDENKNLDNSSQKLDSKGQLKINDHNDEDIINELHFGDQIDEEEEKDKYEIGKVPQDNLLFEKNGKGSNVIFETDNNAQSSIQKPEFYGSVQEHDSQMRINYTPHQTSFGPDDSKILWNSKDKNDASYMAVMDGSLDHRKEDIDMSLEAEEKLSRKSNPNDGDKLIMEDRQNISENRCNNKVVEVYNNNLIQMQKGGDSSKKKKKKSNEILSKFDNKATFICQFCGGKGCKLENWLKIKNPAIKGLNSNWISDEIIASQRLSSRQIKEFDIMKQFKEHNLKAVINLQEPGEHPYCGDGVQKSTGFSYDPEDLYRNNIQFFNFNWPDLETTNSEMILKVVKAVDFCLQEEKSSMQVHCHAGRGRTGIIICSALVYRKKMTAEDAIALFRSKREGKALDNKNQQKCVKNFEEYIKVMLGTFDTQLTAKVIVKNQNKALNIKQSDFAKNIPKILVDIFNQFGKLKDKGLLSIKQFLLGFYNVKSEIFKTEWDKSFEAKLTKIKQEYDKRNNLIPTIEDPRIQCQLLLDFLEGLYEAIIPKDFFLQFPNLFHTQEDAREFQLSNTSSIKNMRPFQYHIQNIFSQCINEMINEGLNEKSEPMLDIALYRISISLLKDRKDNDNYFIKRSLIVSNNVKQLVHAKQLVTLLRVWIKDFSEDFNQNYKSMNSPMPRLNKKVRDHNDNNQTLNSEYGGNSFTKNKIKRDNTKDSINVGNEQTKNGMSVRSMPDNYNSARFETPDQAIHSTGVKLEDHEKEIYNDLPLIFKQYFRQFESMGKHEQLEVIKQMKDIIGSEPS